MFSTQSQTNAFDEFKDILIENCFVLSFSDEPNILTKEQSLVVRDIERYLENPREQNKRINVIIKGLKKLCSKQKYFKKALLPSVLQKENVDITVEQDSLIKLLLKVNVLQTDVMEMILDEMVRTVSLDDDNPSWLRLLLHQLQYLPNINKGEELTTKLLDTLEICNQAQQLEILDVLPEILPDNRYNQAGKQLLQFLNSTDSPTSAIIDCLSALNLDDGVKKEIQDVILLRILPSRIQHFPVLMEFILDSTKGGNSALMFKIRDTLDSVMSGKSNPEKDSSKVLIFNKLKRFVITRKHFVQDCLDLVNVIKISTDHQPIDCLLLFLVYSVAQNKKQIVELVFRKKVKENVLKPDLLDRLFKNYMPQHVFKELFHAIVGIGCSLIRTSNDISVRLFSENLFESIFGHKNTEGIYQREILNDLLMLAGNNDKRYVEQVLGILLMLIKNDVNKFKQHALLMMRLLEIMDYFDLDGIKSVFEILCTLTCIDDRDESMLSMRDEIHMIIRKQLSIWKKNIKFRGIIGAVIMAKRIAENDSDNENIELVEDVSSIENLPTDKARDAANLIEMASKRVEGCYESMGLFYDELALMLYESENLEPNFQNWLCEIILQKFLDTFIVTDFENVEFNEIRYSPQFCLNSKDDHDIPVLINIGLMTVKPQQGDKSSIILLASHFRLLRCLIHKKHNGDLTAIDALIGSAVMLPEVEDADDLNPDQIRQVSDCYFHCINWFRELISAFIFYKPTRTRLIKRLEQLIELEFKFNNFISNAPDHLLPLSYFNTLSQNKQVVTCENKKKIPSAKRFKSKAIIHDETATSNVLTGREPLTSTTTPVKACISEKIEFREIDTDYFRLFELKIDNGLKLSTFLFMLNDLVKKLNVVLLGKKTKTPINVLKPMDLVRDLIQLMPKINENFLIITKRIKERLEENDGREDLPEIFNVEMNQLKTAFIRVLESYVLIFDWPELHQAKNLEILREALLSLRVEKSHLISVSFLALELINYFADFVEQCLFISQGVFLVKFLRILDKLAATNKKKKSVTEISRDLLNKRWYNDKGVLDSGKLYSQSINYLVDSYLDSMKIDELEELIANVLMESENLKTKDDYLTMLASIDYKNFRLFYQGLCAALHKNVKNNVATSLTNAGHLELWKKTTDAMSNLMAISRTIKNTLNFSIFLKKSVAILRIFIAHGVPILEKIFKKHSEDVVKILKALQSSTRFLHHLCCDSKVNKTTSLIAHIPSFRLLLEQLVFRVKALLFANNCQDAFHMGNLKNKDIDGNTQTTERDEDDEEDEVMPPDDEDEDNDTFDRSDDEEVRSKSDSEVFD